MAKKGIATKDEIKIFVKFVADAENLKGITRTIVTLVLPGLLDGIDNKVGDKLKEPWQTIAETLFTMLAEALEDNVILEEEATEIADYCARVLNENIDVPLIAEDVKAFIFQELLRLLAGLLYSKVTTN